MPRTAPVLILIAILSAVAPPAASAPRLQGSWEGRLTLEAKAHTVIMTFDVKGSGFNGEVYEDGEEFGPMTDCKLEENKVSFKVDVIAFGGTLAGDELELNVTPANGRIVPMVATRKEATAGR